MNYQVFNGLPFVHVYLTYKGKQIRVENVLIDTGSYGTIFNSDILLEIGIKPEIDDVIDTISGVGGIEFVIKKKIDQIKLDSTIINDFEIEVGAMNYGFNIFGILGYNFIQKAELVIDSKNQKIYKHQ